MCEGEQVRSISPTFLEPTPSCHYFPAQIKYQLPAELASVLLSGFILIDDIFKWITVGTNLQISLRKGYLDIIGCKLFVDYCVETIA